MSVFVDTGVFIAAALRKEARHRQAARLLRRIATESPTTTDHVIVEAWAILRSRAGWATAMRFWRGLRGSALRLEATTPVDLERAQSIAEQWEDQELDIVDCTSFAVMERIRCDRAATFDTDFSVYRFGRDRRQAFEILG